MFEPLAERKGLHFEVELDDGVPASLYTDRTPAGTDPGATCCPTTVKFTEHAA
jgi:hypothetical protein